MLLAQRAAGQATPALASRPIVPERFGWLYECFEELTLDRTYISVGMSSSTPRPLTTSQIQTYYEAFKLSKFGVDFGWFYEGIRFIDLLWLDVVTSKVKKVDAPAGKAGKTAAPIPKYQRPK